MFYLRVNFQELYTFLVFASTKLEKYIILNCFHQVQRLLLEVLANFESFQTHIWKNSYQAYSTKLVLDNSVIDFCVILLNNGNSSSHCSVGLMSVESSFSDVLKLKEGSSFFTFLISLKIYFCLCDSMKISLLQISVFSHCSPCP